MMKIIGSLLFASYVFVTVNLLVLYNYDDGKIINDSKYVLESINGCPIKPEILHLSNFYYNNQNMQGLNIN